jgi:hypothetical protein
MEDFNSQTATVETGAKEDFKTRTSKLKDHAGEYVKTYVALAKAKATAGASNVASGLVIGIAALLFTLFFLIFLFTAIGFWLGNVFESYAAGFFAVAGFFMLLIVLVFALRKKVIVPKIRNTIISKIYE